MIKLPRLGIYFRPVRANAAKAFFVMPLCIAMRSIDQRSFSFLLKYYFGLFHGSICLGQHFLNRPTVVRDASRLRGCHAVRRMFADKIEIGCEDGNRMAQVFQFLGIAQSLASEPPGENTQRKIHTLGMAGCRVGQIRVADSALTLYGHNDHRIKPL